MFKKTRFFDFECSYFVVFIEIIKIIEDIAFQTNILALNAAVEAARAGQAQLLKEMVGKFRLK